MSTNQIALDVYINKSYKNVIRKTLKMTPSSKTKQKNDKKHRKTVN